MIDDDSQEDSNEEQDINIVVVDEPVKPGPAESNYFDAKKKISDKTLNNYGYITPRVRTSVIKTA